VAVDASIYVPDLSPPETRVVGVDAATSTFALQLEGTETGGAGMRHWDVYVEVDGGPIQHVGTAPAGTADENGLYQGSLLYQAIADGTEHAYRFYAVGEDGAGNRETPPVNPADDVVVTAAFSPPANLQPTAFDVQKGANQRSFIRFLDVMFNSDAGACSGSAWTGAVPPRT